MMAIYDLGLLRWLVPFLTWALNFLQTSLGLFPWWVQSFKSWEQKPQGFLRLWLRIGVLPFLFILLVKATIPAQSSRGKKIYCTSWWEILKYCGHFCRLLQNSSSDFRLLSHLILAVMCDDHAQNLSLTCPGRNITRSRVEVYKFLFNTDGCVLAFREPFFHVSLNRTIRNMTSGLPDLPEWSMTILPSPLLLFWNTYWKSEWDVAFSSGNKRHDDDCKALK